MEGEKIFGSRLDIIARLGCFKPVYLLREYVARGEVERAEKILSDLIEDLRRYSKDLAEMAQQISRAKNISSMGPEDAARSLEEVLSIMRSKIFSSPQGARLCIYIQPHLEVMYGTLNNIKQDLVRGYGASSRYFVETALKDLEAYLAYISKYIEGLLNNLSKL